MLFCYWFTRINGQRSKTTKKKIFWESKEHPHTHTHDYLLFFFPSYFSMAIPMKIRWKRYHISICMRQCIKYLSDASVSVIKRNEKEKNKFVSFFIARLEPKTKTHQGNNGRWRIAKKKKTEEENLIKSQDTE